MPYSVRVQPTVYDGHSFRSKTEARFAAFFNALDTAYLYEPNVYEFPIRRKDSPLHADHPSGTVKYIPDFFLPDYNVFVEIKPRFPLHIECIKAHLLATSTQKHVFVLWDVRKQHLLQFTPQGNIRMGNTLQLCSVCDRLNLAPCPCPHPVFQSKHPKRLTALRTATQFN